MMHRSRRRNMSRVECTRIPGRNYADSPRQDEIELERPSQRAGNAHDICYTGKSAVGRKRFMRKIALLLAAWFVLLVPLPARADDRDLGSPTSITLYAGPATTKFFGAVFQSFNMHPTAAMAGAAVDHRLIYLGAGIWLGAEATGGEYWFGHHDTAYGVGLGFQINDPFGFRHASFSFYDGPSWDTDPPHLALGYDNKVFPEERARFLNYISIEEAIALSRSGNWDGVIRWYHRSGMFGVYSRDDDGGMAIGLGVRYRF